jgi:tetratricopeptide (TPR) repeat protein
MILLEGRKYHEALGEFSNIVLDKAGEGAKYADAWIGRGSAFLENGSPDSAIQDFDQAIRLNPDLANAYCERGQAYTEMGDYRQAIQDTTKAIGMKPDFALAYLHRAKAYLEENRFDRALADLNEAVKLDSEAVKLGPDLEHQARSMYFEIYRGQGSNHLAARCWDKAIASFEKAIAFDKSKATQFNLQLVQAYRERGFDHAKHREFEEAVRDLKKAFELDRDNAQNHRLFGLTCSMIAQACHDGGMTADEKKQLKSAVAHLKWAIRLDPEMEYQLRRPLADAQRNLDAVSAPANATDHTGI